MKKSPHSTTDFPQSVSATAHVSVDSSDYANDPDRWHRVPRESYANATPYDPIPAALHAWLSRLSTAPYSNPFRSST